MSRIPNIGEPDPNTLYLGIGQALSQWEFLEYHVSLLYTIFIGTPRLGTAIQGYGDDYGTTGKRLAAVDKAGFSYFARCPDQSNEGEFASLIVAVRSASSERHRIAHGLVTPVAILDPDDADSNGWITLGSRYHYFLGAPWYSVGSLKMSPFEMNAAMVDERRETFRLLTERAANLANKLSPET
jgi:hypothetical protein